MVSRGGRTIVLAMDVIGYPFVGGLTVAGLSTRVWVAVKDGEGGAGFYFPQEEPPEH
jgi:hypothetical protein